MGENIEKKDNMQDTLKFLLVMVFASYGFLIFIAAAYKKIIFKLAN